VLPLDHLVRAEATPPLLLRNELEECEERIRGLTADVQQAAQVEVIDKGDRARE